MWDWGARKNKMLLIWLYSQNGNNRNASILKGGRVVFNIAGNKYRLVVEVVYKIGVIYVKFVGPHKQYDKIDAEEYNDEPIQGYKN